MPYHLSQGGGSCAASEWAVVKDDDGKTMGCHGSQADAKAQLAALYANDPDATKDRARVAAAVKRRAVRPAGTELRGAVPPDRVVTVRRGVGRGRRMG
jgi:hypothetical protein